MVPVSLDILTNSQYGLIPQIFSMFGQLVGYILSGPSAAIGSILSTWGQSFFHYGIVIPIIFVLVLALTGFALTIIIESSKTVESLGNVVGDVGGGEAALAIPFGFLPLYTFPSIFTSIVSAFITGILDLFQQITDAITLSVQDIVSGIMAAFGSPFQYWASDVSRTGLMVPIMFISILMFTGFIAFFFLDAQGMESDVLKAGEGLVQL